MAFLYKNYKRNEILKENSFITFSSRIMKFSLPKYDNTINGDEVLLDVEKINNNEILDFLSKTNDKIVFNPKNIDTLRISFDRNNKYSFTSTLDLGKVGKDFKSILVEKICRYLRNKNITNIELYVIIPTEADNAPPPTGMPNNF